MRLALPSHLGSLPIRFGKPHFLLWRAGPDGWVVQEQFLLYPGLGLPLFVELRVRVLVSVRRL